jgi:hypothetical protein
MFSRLVVAAIGGAIAAGGLGLAYVAGYSAGRPPAIERVERARVLADLLVSTQKLLLVEREQTQEFRWKLAPEHPFVRTLARLFDMVFRKESEGTFQYTARYAYGYDLGERGRWSIEVEAGKVIFNAPPIALLVCPSVLTHTFRASVDQRSVWVAESLRVPQLGRYVTAQALASAHATLRQPAARAPIKDAIETQFRSLVIGLTSPLGWNLKPEDITIRYAREVDAEDWQLGAMDGTGLAPAVLDRLSAVGCGTAETPG